jgi:hypothetical protein
MSNQRKPEPSNQLLKRQILRNAAAYTDEKINELRDYLERALEENDFDEEDISDPGDDPDPGSGGGGGIGVVFPPDLPVEWVIPPLPGRDITPVGTVDSIEFQKSDGSFEYDEEESYGYTYLSSDGGFTGSVTVKVTGSGEIDDFELQVTKID